MRYLPAFVVAFVFAIPLVARADVIYTLDIGVRLSPGSPGYGDYTFTVPSLLTTETLIPGSAVTTLSGVPLSLFDINPNGGLCLGSGSPSASSCYQIDLLSGSGRTTILNVPLTAFGTYLVGTDITGNETLTIANSVASTPEPSSILLLATGAILAAAATKRRLLAGRAF